MSDTLGDLGERGIYRELLAPRYQDVEGFGDDSAVLRGGISASTDSCPTPLIEKVRNQPDPFHEGWLLATINLSDLAAAGAEPLGLVVNYTLAPDTAVDDFKMLVDGVDACARAHGTQVVGGDLRDGAVRHLTATAIGKAKSRLSRRGANDGDVLLLVGNPGYLWGWAAAESGFAPGLSAEDKDKLWQLASRPMAQLVAAQLLAQDGLAAAAVDVSDGLYASVRLLAEANGLGAELTGEMQLDPVLRTVCDLAGFDPFALGQTWGDWSLLVAVRPEQAGVATAMLQNKQIGVRRIGTMVGAHEELLVGGAAWSGVDQERFSDRSWRGGGIKKQLRSLVKIQS